MPRRKPLTTAESDERLAYAVASGHWSNLACCRHADRPFRSRQAAADYIANKLADAAFCSRVERYQEMLARDDANLRNTHQQARDLNRAWVLWRLRRIYLVAMGDEPSGIDDKGEEAYLAHPNLGAAIRALSEMAKVLPLTGEAAEDDDDELSRVLAEIAAERQVN